MGFFQWYAGFSPWIRFGIALIFLCAGLARFLFEGVFWPLAWGLGGVLLIFAIPSESDKNGF